MTIPADQEKYLDRLEGIVGRGERALGTKATGGSMAVSINAGGIGVWVATTCCVVMVCCGLIGALWVSYEFKRYDEKITALEDYIHAIYMAAPSLKPPEKK